MDQEPAHVPSVADRLGEPFPIPPQSGSPLKGPTPPESGKLQSSNALGLIQAYSSDEESESEELGGHTTSNQSVPEDSGGPRGQPAKAPDGKKNPGGKSCKDGRCLSIAEEGSAYCAQCLPPQREGRQGTLEREEDMDNAASPGASIEVFGPGAPGGEASKAPGGEVIKAQHPPAEHGGGEPEPDSEQAQPVCKRCRVQVPAGRKVCDDCSGWGKRRSSVPGGGSRHTEERGGRGGSFESDREEEADLQSACKKCGVWIPARRKLCDEHSTWAKRKSLGTPQGGPNKKQRPKEKEDGEAQPSCKNCGIAIPEGRKVCDEHSAWGNRRSVKRPAPWDGSSDDGSESSEDESSEEEASEPEREAPRVKCKHCERIPQPGLRLCAVHNPWTKRKQSLGKGAQESRGGEGAPQPEEDVLARCKRCRIPLAQGQEYCEAHGPGVQNQRGSGGITPTPRSPELGARKVGETGERIGEGGGETAAKESGKNAMVENQGGEKACEGGVGAVRKCEKCDRNAKPGKLLCGYHIEATWRLNVEEAPRPKKRPENGQEKEPPADRPCCRYCPTRIAPGSKVCEKHSAWKTTKGGAASGGGAGGGPKPKCGHAQRTCQRPAIEGSKLCLEHYSCLAGRKRLLEGGAEKNESPPPAAVLKGGQNKLVGLVRGGRKFLGPEVRERKRKAVDGVRKKYAALRAKRVKKAAEEAGGRRCHEKHTKNGRLAWQCSNEAAPGKSRCAHHLEGRKRYQQKVRAQRGLTRPGHEQKHQDAGVSGDAQSQQRPGHEGGRQATKRLDPRQTLKHFRSRGHLPGKGGAKRCYDCPDPAVRGTVRCELHNEVDNRRSRQLQKERGARATHGGAAFPDKRAGGLQAKQPLQSAAQTTTGTEQLLGGKADIPENIKSGGSERDSGKPGVAAKGPAASASVPPWGVLVQTAEAPPAAEPQEGTAQIQRCQRQNVGMGKVVWRCKEAAAEGKTLCLHHEEWVKQRNAKTKERLRRARRAKVGGAKRAREDGPTQERAGDTTGEAGRGDEKREASAHKQKKRTKFADILNAGVSLTKQLGKASKPPENHRPSKPPAVVRKSVGAHQGGAGWSKDLEGIARRARGTRCNYQKKTKNHCEEDRQPRSKLCAYHSDLAKAIYLSRKEAHRSAKPDKGGENSLGGSGDGRRTEEQGRGSRGPELENGPLSEEGFAELNREGREWSPDLDIGGEPPCGGLEKGPVPPKTDVQKTAQNGTHLGSGPRVSGSLINEGVGERNSADRSGLGTSSSSDEERSARLAAPDAARERESGGFRFEQLAPLNPREELHRLVKQEVELLMPIELERARREAAERAAGRQGTRMGAEAGGGGSAEEVTVTHVHSRPLMRSVAGTKTTGTVLVQ